MTTQELQSQIDQTRRLQYVASQTRDAGAVMRLEETLLRLYADLDSRK